MLKTLLVLTGKTFENPSVRLDIKPQKLSCLPNIASCLPRGNKSHYIITSLVFKLNERLFAPRSFVSFHFQFFAHPDVRTFVVLSKTTSILGAGPSRDGSDRVP